MTTLGQLRKSIGTAQELNDLVGTMETLAAVNIRQYEQTVRAIDGYVSTIELGFQIVLRTAPELAHPTRATTGRSAIIAFGTDQGLCGAINSRLVEHVRRVLRDRPDAFVLPVGHRVTQQLLEDDIELLDELRPPHSVSAIGSLVADLLGMLGDWQDRGDLRDVVVVYNRPHAVESAKGGRGGGFDTIDQRLLPLDEAWLETLEHRPWESRRLPTFRDDPDVLYSWLVREWLFSRLFLACAASLAAENSSRLETTHAAGVSIADRLAELQRRHRSLRQSTITEELMDLYRG
jgi:F-type H+-transporting ATPase subunit gamma